VGSKDLQADKESTRTQRRYRDAYVRETVEDETERLRSAFNSEGRRIAAGQAELFSSLSEVVLEVDTQAGRSGSPWTDKRWNDVTPTVSMQSCIRMGSLELRLPSFAGIKTIPMLMQCPPKSNLVFIAGVEQRQSAIDLIRSQIFRLLSAIPPGAVEFIVFDPVALGQSVADFRHLAEYDQRLVDTKTWTSEQDIERRLSELSAHLETVISNYLRGQFETIAQYNSYAGEVAEPYRILVVFDFPSGFSDSAAATLQSIMENGPRCGLHTILLSDPAAGLPRRTAIERLRRSAQTVTWSGSSATLDLGEPIGIPSHDLAVDDAPPLSFGVEGTPDNNLAKLLTRVGEASRSGRGGRVTPHRLFPTLNRLIAAGRAQEAPRLMPNSPTINLDEPASWWTGDSARNASAPIGRAGATDLALLNLSSTEIAGGAIVVGVPRSGKSTALHAIITSLAVIYSPQELELYLVDNKHGVEFKAYDRLPHARMVSINSEREFSVSVLRSLDHEVARRADLMKKVGGGVSNISEYREVTGQPLSRIVLVMDEFHEVFEQDDDVGQKAYSAFSNIVKQGPFAGVHVIVATQSLPSMPAMNPLTLQLLPIRIAFMCSASDADVVMGDANREVKSLSKQGEGILNPVRGEPAFNKSFQGMYIEPAERTGLLEMVLSKAVQEGITQLPRVFDGDEPAQRTVEAKTSSGNGLVVDLGESYELDGSAELPIRRTRGANLLALGNHLVTDGFDPAILGAIESAVLSTIRSDGDVVLLDFVGEAGIPEGSLGLVEVASATGSRYERGARSFEVLRQLAETVRERVERGAYEERAVALVLFGLQRATELVPYDPYMESSDDGDEPSPGANLASIVRDGPDVGLHVVVAVDSLAQFERKCGRDLLREFDLRIAGSMASPGDISTIADTSRNVELRTSQVIVVDNFQGAVTRLRAYGEIRSIGELSRRIERG
jgi:S-DNA-T family DNA segregation ATPase FtsK/SpoIIIE